MTITENKIYICGIWGIGVSAIARYYLSKGYNVAWSDTTDSELIRKLREEGCDIVIWSNPERIDISLEKIIYSEAVPLSQWELKRGTELWISLMKYSQSLWELCNSYNLIAVTGTHWKSTTSSMISQIMKNSNENFVSIVGTLLKEFDGKNFFTRGKGKNFFVIEACEYKEHFLAYTPLVGIITNIEYDHVDYFKTPESYVASFKKFIWNIKPWGFCLISWDDINSQKLIWLREDIHYITVYNNSFIFQWETNYFPEIVLHIPWEHILFDAKLAYIVWHLIWIPENIILDSLEDYSWVWRRMEKIGLTKNKNILMSDYGHHPTEISKTLEALKNGYPKKKLFVIFQPHQYSRTIELLDGFKDSFSYADSVIIPNIYASRDSQENKKKINTQIFVEYIKHTNIKDGHGLTHSLWLIQEYDETYPNSSIILLLWAWDIDNLRYQIKTEL